jgi:hypothetical protein
MIEIISCDRQMLYYNCYDDPDRVEVQHYGGHFLKADMLPLFGVDIPENCTMITFEPHVGIYVVGYDDGLTTEMYEDPSGHPILQAIADNKHRIRKQATAQYLKTLAPANVNIVYNEQTDSFDAVDYPDREHLDARTNMERKSLRVAKHFLELCEVLQSKGIVTPADFSQEFKSDITKIKAIRDKINWDEV